ncbi:uncharacterized protein LOC112342547 [Selaginella moellendorffii]|uniref:uncharacterized protein LOC112342547 n=1 Tax=Selaginella moellendorffii TaxID=88036 RepID=UPI000D1C88B9|nr:uncharacterized protein LOC112342547 [Selaginella moellendorffii]|eukprot:XP_024520330.1 uncharacterized protein LOC112342547 [Selaginella moellendorffii]
MLLKVEGYRAPALDLFVINPGRGRSRTSRLMVQCSARDGDSDGNGMGGDVQVQRALVEMIQMQVSKVKMSEFVEERSQYMKTIAQDYRHDHARIAFRAMKELDAAGSRVLRELDAGAGAIEEELRMARADLEAQSKSIDEYQRWSAHLRNEGLFFKNLYTAPDRSKASRKDLVVSSPSGNFSASYKQFLSGGISLVLASFVYSSGSGLLTGTLMRPWKLASYGIILTLLLTQLAYADVLVGEEVESSSKDQG